MNVRDGWISTIPFAHRGLHTEQSPENSLPAFEAAVDAGFGIELDVHCSADNRVIVFHDDDTFRMTGRHLQVKETESDELTRLRLGKTQHVIPMLDDVLAKVAGRVPLLIEVKPSNSMDRLGPPLLQILHHYSGPVAVQSFDPRVLLWMRKNAPAIIRGQLSGLLSGECLPVFQKWLLRSMIFNLWTEPQFISFNVEAMPSVFASLWRTILRVPLLLWTIGSDEQLEKARRYRANVIFEDVRPALTA